MMAANQSELDSFHSFASQALPGASHATLEDLLAVWRTEQERAEAVASIRRGVADAAAGRLCSLSEVDADIRAKLRLPPRQ
jgi:predicted transcriptional regulator